MATRYTVLNTVGGLVLGAAATYAVGTAGGLALHDTSPAAVLTANGDVMVRAAGAPARLAIGSSATLLRSTGTAPAWATGTTVLDDLASTRGYLLRRGASVWEGLAASAADTFVGGDGTDVGVRTASQVLASLGRTYGAPQTAYAGPFSSTAYLGGDAGFVEPSVVLGRSLVVVFYKTAAVASEQLVASRLDASAVRGWALGVGSGGSFYGYIQGVGATTLGGFNALSSGAVHALALSVHDAGSGNFQWRYSVDGGAVSSASDTSSGSMVAADATTPLYLGRQANGSFPFALTSADLIAVQTYSTEVSDADLALLSAANASPRATVTGTVAFDWYAPRDFWPGYATSRTGAGSQVWDLTVNGSLTRRIH